MCVKEVGGGTTEYLLEFNLSASVVLHEDALDTQVPELAESLVNVVALSFESAVHVQGNNSEVFGLDCHSFDCFFKKFVRGGSVSLFFL